MYLGLVYFQQNLGKVQWKYLVSYDALSLESIWNQCVNQCVEVAQAEIHKAFQSNLDKLHQKLTLVILRSSIIKLRYRTIENLLIGRIRSVQVGVG